MKLAIVTLTKGASELGSQLRDRIGGTLYCKAEYAENLHGYATEKPFKAFVGRLFQEYDALVFIMATGIVVRSLAPYIESKVSDPAVIVMDEAGKHAISLLSGHLGGGNALAEKVGQTVGARPVITTASDVTGNLAVDMFAQNLGMAIGSMEGAKDVTAIGINGGRLHIYTSKALPSMITKELPENVVVHIVNDSMENAVERFREKQNDNGAEDQGAMFITSRSIELPEHSVQLIPRNFVVGIGCRRNSKAEVIREVYLSACEKAQIDYRAIRLFATIQLKADEAGIHALLEDLQLPLEIVGLNDIKEVQGQFKGSDFVEKTIGVRAVAEPCAMLAGNNGAMRLHRYADQGVTIAIWEENNALER